ncbi:MAG: hypothetical protein PGN07_07950 [Aeromicrobium erythreum]
MGLFSRRRPPVTVTYAPRGVDGDLDQTVRFRNGSETGLRPVLQFQPVDHYGRDLPNVEVGTVLGIDRGAVVAPPGQDAVDVLHFHGMGARHVRGVRIMATTIEPVDLADLSQPVEAVMVDLERRATLDPEEFWGVGVVNRNESPASVSVTLIQLEDPAESGDDPRQAVDAVTLAEPVELPSKGHDVVWLPDDVRGRFHAVLAQVVVPWTGPLDPEVGPDPV